MMKRADRTALMTAAILLAAAALAACQYQKPVSNDPTGARASRADWSANIVALMPAVRVCADNPARPAANVLKAWPMRGGLIGVRMTDLTGMRVDCIAERGGGRIDSVAEVGATDILPSEGRPIFYPASRGEPLCSGLRLVRINGVLEGWKRSAACR
jgi:hypothetical protein